MDYLLERVLIWSSLTLCGLIMVVANVSNLSEEVGAACTVIGAATLAVALCAEAVKGADIRRRIKVAEAIGISLGSAGVLLSSASELTTFGAIASVVAVLLLLALFGSALGSKPGN
jgi:hypothetical protein